MNSRAKGRRIENEFMKLLTDHGFIVNPPVPSRKFNKQVDHWGGRFDVEAISLRYPEPTFFFQISTRWKCGNDRTHIEKFPASPSRRVYMVRRKDNSGFELKEYMGLPGWEDVAVASFLGTYGTGNGDD